MVSVGSYKEEYIEYNGHKAKVIERNDVKRTITIEYNGEIYTVNINDLFGINDKIDNSEHIDFLNKKIEERAESIKTLNVIWNEFKELIRSARAGINALFASLGISDKSQIENEDDMKIYIEYTDAICSAKGGQRGTSAELLSKVNSNLSDISSKHRFELQQLLT